MKDDNLPLKAPHTDTNPAQIVFISDWSPIPEWTRRLQIPAWRGRISKDVLAVQQCVWSNPSAVFDPENPFFLVSPALVRQLQQSSKVWTFARSQALCLREATERTS